MCIYILRVCKSKGTKIAKNEEAIQRKGEARAPGGGGKRRRKSAGTAIAAAVTAAFPTVAVTSRSREFGIGSVGDDDALIRRYFSDGATGEKFLSLVPVLLQNFSCDAETCY